MSYECHRCRVVTHRADVVLERYCVSCRLFEDEAAPEPRHWTWGEEILRPCRDPSRSAERLAGMIGRAIAFTHLTEGPVGLGVSTAFTGIEVLSADGGKPVLFETRVLTDDTGRALDALSREYSTAADAEAGHKDLVALLCERFQSLGRL